ncbi:MAG TPA: response regulator transcription factor [Roseiflexaceae bacterium]|nr:response regulator transcription factor [Roseiflexaceae bacterium]
MHCTFSAMLHPNNHVARAAIMPTILIIEDTSAIVETLRYHLEREGYRVLSTDDGADGLALARAEQPDLVILDIMLPRLDGFSICRILREESDLAIIILSARQDEIDRIAGLELGADDYLVKPFSFGELLARVRGLLRRAERRPDIERDILEVAAFRIDTGSRRVWVAQKEIKLSQKEYELLVYLVRNAGIALARQLLLERIWGHDFIGDHRTVDVHIRWLREKVESDPGRPIYIQTVRGIGYRFGVPEE